MFLSDSAFFAPCWEVEQGLKMDQLFHFIRSGGRGTTKVSKIGAFLIFDRFKFPSKFLCQICKNCVKIWHFEWFLYRSLVQGVNHDLTIKIFYLRVKFCTWGLILNRMFGYYQEIVCSDIIKSFGYRFVINSLMISFWIFP